MAVRKVLIWPNVTLNEVSSPVEDVMLPEHQLLIADMVDTMKARGGVGLAAIQVGTPARIFVTMRSETEAPKVFVNPVFKELIDEPFEMEEGCLSLPGIYEKAMRHPEVVVEYQDQTGAKQLAQLGGLEAQIAQHEMEHLEGKIFIEKMGFARRTAIKAKIAKTLREAKRKAAR